MDEERPGGVAVVGGGDGAEALLAGGAPDLGPHLPAVDVRRALRLELHPDGGFGVRVEFVARVPGQQVALPHRAGVVVPWWGGERCGERDEWEVARRDCWCG